MENSKTKNKKITIIACVLLAVIAISFLLVGIFGNGSGDAVAFSDTAEFSSVVFRQTCTGDADNSTLLKVYIEGGDNFAVYYDGGNGKETLSSEIVGGKLTISVETKQDIFGNIFSSESSILHITIPESYNIDSFNISADLATFEITNIASETFIFDGESTVAKIYDSSFENSAISSAVGNIYAYDTAFGEFVFDGGTTNPEFKYCTFDNFDMYIAFGNLLVASSEIENINLTADMGYVDMTEITLAGDMYAYADYGAVVISIVGDVEDFILYSKISESGKYYLDENLASGKDETLQQLTIATYIGDIDVSFIN